ncbi:hypothetical protein ACK2FS_06575 [Clostridioides difficile]
MKKDSLKKYIMIGAFALILFGIASINFKSLDKTKTQISSPTLDTHEYDWYFNPREDGKQPSPIKEADFLKNTELVM